ncbi:MAG: ATP synthase F1 subunit epsilon, partial [Patescibacteria group bacterium]|nr:ATP synthase F1 subunit epsilon [Patescibacteria group bacterium]
MNNLYLSIFTLKKKLYEGQVRQVNVPSKDGDIGILAHHTPLIAALKPGEILIKTNEKKEKISIEGGFLEVKQNSQAVILATT